MRTDLNVKRLCLVEMTGFSNVNTNASHRITTRTSLAPNVGFVDNDRYEPELGTETLGNPVEKGGKQVSRSRS